MNWSRYRSISIRGARDEDWRFSDEPASVVVLGKTHGCSCCSSDEVVTLEKIDEHIAGLMDELKVARKARGKLVKQQNKERDVR